MGKYTRVTFLQQIVQNHHLDTMRKTNLFDWIVLVINIAPVYKDYSNEINWNHPLCPLWDSLLLTNQYIYFNISQLGCIYINLAKSHPHTCFYVGVRSSIWVSLTAHTQRGPGDHLKTRRSEAGEQKTVLGPGPWMLLQISIYIYMAWIGRFLELFFVMGMSFDDTKLSKELAYPKGQSSTRK